ncbi:MAG: hypothetical protein ACLGH8_06270 [Bacteroidia bacterium]
MESRLIYESNKIYSYKVIWNIFQNESEWNFIGNENITEEKIRNIIEQHFSEDDLYLVLDRNDSQEISKTETPKKIIEICRDTNFTIWNKKFQQIIEFNKNGIFRVGTRPDA